MSEASSRIIRRHKTRKDDGKGARRYIAGWRFRCPKGVSQQEAERRFLLIEQLWRDNEVFCHRTNRPVEWNTFVSTVADIIRRNGRRVPLPDLDALFEFFPDEPEVAAINRFIIENEDQAGAGEVDDLDFEFVMDVFNLCYRYFPSVPWELPPRQQVEIAASHERQARYSTRKFAQATGAKPPDPNTPLVEGTLHEALAKYRKEREREVTLPDGNIDATGHYMLGLVETLKKAHPDVPLNMLDLTRCKELIDHWRYRPPSERGDKEPLTAKVCRERLWQLDLFFRWLHLTDKYTWRKPADFSELDRKIRSLPSDKRSIRELQIPTFSLEELGLLYRHASPFERLLLVWCLNCSFGAAEVGRLCWEDIYRHQQHPWTPQGLRVDSTQKDSWCGLLRSKTDVLGWWWLFPETVQLLDWWRDHVTVIIGREPRPDDRIMLTQEGTSLYRDLSKNSQSGFTYRWRKVLKRVNNSSKSDETRSPPSIRNSSKPTFRLARRRPEQRSSWKPCSCTWRSTQRGRVAVQALFE